MVEMVHIEARDCFRAATHRRLKHQLIPRIGQLRPPEVTDLDGLGDPRQRVQDRIDVVDGGAARGALLTPLQHRLVLDEQ